MLLRRVLHGFGVSANNVHFIATSATIVGGNEQDSITQLQNFLADLAGVVSSRVTVIQGSRAVPRLPDGLARNVMALPPIGELQDQDDEKLFEILASNKALINIRNALVKHGSGALSELVEVFREGGEWLDRKNHLLNILDLASCARRGEVQFLPLRTHLFHRTQNGLRSQRPYKRRQLATVLIDTFDTKCRPPSDTGTSSIL